MENNINDKISALKKEIKQLEKKKNKGSFKQKIKNSAKALKQSADTVFGELGKASGQIMSGFEDVDDTIRRMPQ